MAIDRSNTFNQNTTPPLSGSAFLAQYGAYMDALIDVATLRLTNVGGTANAITATAEPFQVPASGLVAGMKVTLEPAFNNTGAATLDIDGRGAADILKSDGTILTPDTLVSGTLYLLAYTGAAFVILSGGAGAGAASSGSSRTVFDATAVWTNSLSANTLVMVELWGAGGGGVGGSLPMGGGGGAYASRVFRAGDLPSSVTITVGSGGAVSTNGGDTTFGTLLTGFGGQRGGNSGSLGRGGGELQSGNSGGAIGGGWENSGTIKPDALTVNGGGGGAVSGGGTVAGGVGGKAVNGGAGGGVSGGTSAYGGFGGGSGNAGQRPGGGGGTAAPGGGGRCILTVFGG